MQAKILKYGLNTIWYRFQCLKLPPVKRAMNSLYKKEPKIDF